MCAWERVSTSAGQRHVSVPIASTDLTEGLCSALNKTFHNEILHAVLIVAAFAAMSADASFLRELKGKGQVRDFHCVLPLRAPGGLHVVRRWRRNVRVGTVQ